MSTAHDWLPKTEPWPEPQDIRPALPAVMPLDPQYLPPALRGLVADTADRMQVPQDYPAAVAVAALAGAVNRRVLIQPKANDPTWTVVPNLWAAIVAPPGFLKTPVIETTLRPLYEVQSRWRDAHGQALSCHERELAAGKVRRSMWEREAKAALKNKAELPELPEPPQPPAERRLIVNDATVEKLHEILSGNPAGVLIVRDEIAGWWAGLDKPGREGDRGFHLQCWNGDGSFTIDRIGRGSIHATGLCTSMIGGLQPGRLRSYLADALEDGPANDGLIQRFQILVWPDTASTWTLVDRAPDQEARGQAGRIFADLAELTAAEPLHFRFASDTQQLFYDWLTDLEAKVRGNDLHPALCSHLSKYRSLMPSLAVLFHLASGANGDVVALGHARQAAAFAEYLESHAQRVYASIVTREAKAAEDLASRIRTGKVPIEAGSFSVRDVYRRCWSGLNTREAVEAAARELCGVGWLREAPREATTGRPSDRYEVNPRVTP